MVAESRIEHSTRPMTVHTRPMTVHRFDRSSIEAPSQRVCRPARNIKSAEALHATWRFTKKNPRQSIRLGPLGVVASTLASDRAAGGVGGTSAALPAVVLVVDCDSAPGCDIQHTNFGFQWKSGVVAPACGTRLSNPPCAFRTLPGTPAAELNCPGRRWRRKGGVRVRPTPSGGLGQPGPGII
jgi:hypothetical protein